MPPQRAITPHEDKHIRHNSTVLKTNVAISFRHLHNILLIYIVQGSHSSLNFSLMHWIIFQLCLSNPFHADRFKNFPYPIQCNSFLRSDYLIPYRCYSLTLFRANSYLLLCSIVCKQLHNIGICRTNFF